MNVRYLVVDKNKNDTVFPEIKPERDRVFSSHSRIPIVSDRRQRVCYTCTEPLQYMKYTHKHTQVHMYIYAAITRDRGQSYTDEEEEVSFPFWVLSKTSAQKHN